MDWRSGIAGIIIGLITNIIYELSGISNQIDPIDKGIFNNIWVQRAIITISVALLIYGLLYYLNKRKKELRQKNAPSVFSSNREPKRVYAEGEMQKFGVMWKGKYGTFRDRSYTSLDDAYVYVEGPFCPDDDGKLKSRTVRKWFVFNDKAWVCPRCNSKYPRSTTHYLAEDNVVEDEFEIEFEQEFS